VPRDHDIVLLGATGFVGELTAEYLVAHAPSGARLGIAGRNREKLESLRERLGRGDLALIVVDVGEQAAVTALAESTRVLVSTVGPYLLYGEPVVAACAHAGTDYLDLTGEAEFVDLMYLRHHAGARASGARLVHSCGFDSVPYDLGALFTVLHLSGEVPVQLSGYGSADGSISGGTFQSALVIIGRLKEAGRVARQRRAVERNADDGRIAAGRSVHGRPGRVRREPLAGGWVVPAPVIDPQHVLRTARLDPAYGPDFTYSHYLVTGRLWRTVALGAGVIVVGLLAQLESTRRLVGRLKRPGTGPDAERRARSSFRARFVADHGKDGAERLITEVRGGDPGYGETAKMLSEAALRLAFDDDLPERGGGQWTPALALGRGYIDRLVRAGIEFVVVERPEQA
jgi:short subunit dehydrogenase-like uncharacterized protein